MALLCEVGFHGHLDNLCLAIGVGSKVDDTAARCALCDVIHLVARHGSNIESLDEVVALLTITIHTVVDGALVVLLEHLYVEHVLAHKYLVCHLSNLKLTILVEDNDIVEVGAVAHQLVFLQSCTHKTFLTVDIEFLVGLHHLGNLNGVEVSYLRATWMRLAILAFEVFEPVDGDVSHVRQIVLYLCQLGLDLEQQFVGLVLVVFQDALHLDLQ